MTLPRHSLFFLPDDSSLHFLLSLLPTIHFSSSSLHFSTSSLNDLASLHDVASLHVSTSSLHVSLKVQINFPTSSLHSLSKTMVFSKIHSNASGILF